MASIFMPYFSALAGACRIARKISLRGVRITGFEPFVPRRRKLYFDECKLNTNVPVRDPRSAKGCASKFVRYNICLQRNKKSRTNVRPFSIHCDDYLVFR